MKPSDPEKLLRSVSLRPVPSGLRRRVLAGRSRGGTVFRRAERSVWGVIGVAWVLILALKWTTPELPRPDGQVDVAATIRGWEATRRLALTGELTPEVRRIELESSIIVKPRS
ncbi:MAG: hypothetical protein WA771_11100 [Chthoniobacterales bacterium]